MKQRTLALLLAGAMTLSLLGAGALAADGGLSGSPAEQTEETVSAEEPAGEASGPSAQARSETREKDETPEKDGEDPVEEYIPDPLGSVSFDNLNRRMHESNLTILALQESIDMLEELDYDKMQENLRSQLTQIAQAQWGMVMAAQTGLMNDSQFYNAYDQMDSAYAAVRKQLDAVRNGNMQADNADTVRQLKNAQDQIAMAGEATYIALAAMEIQESGLERQLAALDRQLTELDLRYKLGHISSMTLQQAQAGRAALTSGLSTLRMNLNVYKGQLELLLGADITGEVSLAALPKVTQQELNDMDLERDLDAAKANSWDLYEAAGTMKDAKAAYVGVGGDNNYNLMKNSPGYMQVRHSWHAARYTYDNTVQNFELSLRNLYLKVQDYGQVLDAAKTALAVEQNNYAVAQLKQSQGALSLNALLEAEDKLNESREKVAAAENDLFSAYNTYRWAVDYGILN